MLERLADEAEALNARIQSRLGDEPTWASTASSSGDPATVRALGRAVGLTVGPQRRPARRTFRGAIGRYGVAMEEIRQSVLRNDNAAIMRRVAGGESFVVTVHGRPVADLVPHQRGAGRSRFVPVAVLARALAALPEPDHVAWARDQAQAREDFDDELTDSFAAAGDAAAPGGCR